MIFIQIEILVQMLVDLSYIRFVLFRPVLKKDKKIFLEKNLNFNMIYNLINFSLFCIIF